MKQVVPSLAVADMNESLRFYKEALGFEVTFSMPGPDGKLAHANLKNGDVELMMGPVESAYNVSPGPVGQGVTIYIYVNDDDDIDALFDRAKNAGAKVLVEPRDEFWGDRLWSVSDLDGYQLMVAKHSREVSEEEMTEAIREMAPAG